jgi:hypothetical protein
MIIPSQHASRVARAAAGGGGGGVTPNAVNWANVTGGQPTQTAMLQITGITSTITLRVAYSKDSNAGNDQQYSVQSSASFGTGTFIANNGTFTISNNQYLGFSSDSLLFFGTTTFTITNVSDGDAVIDTFEITAFVGEE